MSRIACHSTHGINKVWPTDAKGWRRPAWSLKRANPWVPSVANPGSGTAHRSQVDNEWPITTSSLHANASKEIKNPVRLYARPFLKDCLYRSAALPGNKGSTWGLWGLRMDIRTKTWLYIIPCGRPLVQNLDLDVYIRDKCIICRVSWVYGDGRNSCLVYTDDNSTTLWSSLQKKKMYKDSKTIGVCWLMGNVN